MWEQFYGGQMFDRQRRLQFSQCNSLRNTHTKTQEEKDDHSKNWKAVTERQHYNSNWDGKVAELQLANGNQMVAWALSDEERLEVRREVHDVFGAVPGARRRCVRAIRPRKVAVVIDPPPQRRRMVKAIRPVRPIPVAILPRWMALEEPCRELVVWRPVIRPVPVAIVPRRMVLEEACRELAILPRRMMELEELVVWRPTTTINLSVGLAKDTVLMVATDGVHLAMVWKEQAPGKESLDQGVLAKGRGFR